MKHLKTIAAVICLTAFAQLTFGQGTIVGSAHDFSGKAWTSNNEICVACHTPHNALAVTDAPLWNHNSTNATFTLYSNSTFNGSASITQPAGVSKLCLSCHDGTVNLDAFGGVAVTGTTPISGPALFSNDLSNDHPISFTYDAALATADLGLWDPTTQTSGLGGTINADMLFSGKVECASCHDVHNSANQLNLLVKSNGTSALCLTCHKK